MSELQNYLEQFSGGTESAVNMPKIYTGETFSLQDVLTMKATIDSRPNSRFNMYYLCGDGQKTEWPIEDTIYGVAHTCECINTGGVIPTPVKMYKDVATYKDNVFIINPAIPSGVLVQVVYWLDE